MRSWLTKCFVSFEELNRPLSSLSFLFLHVCLALCRVPKEKPSLVPPRSEKSQVPSSERGGEAPSSLVDLGPPPPALGTAAAA